jgi:predicted branched-subunit amino acid permease
LLGREAPIGRGEAAVSALVTVLSQFYWVAGTALGALAGAFIHINTKVWISCSRRSFWC